MSDTTANHPTLDKLAQFAKGLPGAGIQGIGFHAALQAMAKHWQDHLTEGHPDEIILNDVDEMIREMALRRHELAEALGLPPRPGLREVTTLASLKIAEEMQGVIIDAYNRWDQADQEDAPSLGDRLEIYAGVDLVREITVDPNTPLKAGKDSNNNLTLLTAPLQRWDVMEGSTAPIEEEPTYQVALDYEHAEGRVHVSMTPQGLNDADALENAPQLSISFEVDRGVPTAHIYPDVHGDLAMSVYGLPGGTLGFRNGDAPVVREIAGQGPSPEAAADSIAQALEQAQDVQHERPGQR